MQESRDSNKSQINQFFMINWCTYKGFQQCMNFERKISKLDLIKMGKQACMIYKCLWP